MGSTDQENRAKLEKISAVATQWLEGAITEYEFAAKTTVILFGEDVNLPRPSPDLNEFQLLWPRPKEETSFQGCINCGHDTCEC